MKGYTKLEISIIFSLNLIFCMPHRCLSPELEFKCFKNLLRTILVHNGTFYTWLLIHFQMLMFKFLKYSVIFHDLAYKLGLLS